VSQSGRLSSGFVWKTGGVDRIGRSPNWSVLRDRPESFGVLSWAPRQSRSVVRHRRSVMTNRMLSQGGVAERSAVSRIRLEGSGCRPNHPHPHQSLARVADWNRGRVSSRSACNGAQDWQTVPPDRKGWCACEVDPLSTRVESSPDGLSRDGS